MLYINDFLFSFVEFIELNSPGFVHKIKIAD